MYVKLPGGTRAPGGYIIPCAIIKQLHGWAYIECEDINGDYKWRQTVRNNQLLTDEEAEANE
jgi:hypothetical protein